jgi:hypothetical protein
VVGNEKIYRTIKCKLCGKEFAGMMARNRRYCDDCRRFKMNASRETHNAEMRWKKQMAEQVRASKKKALSDIMREIKAYNEAHGTCITYGKYIAMKEGARV